MFPTGFGVVVDACALYPLNIRDAILRAVERGMFRIYWSEQILDEMHRNLVADGRMTDDQARRSYRAMNDAFEDAMVTDYEHLIAAMRNDDGDRHVVAVAVKTGAQVIVTSNLRDFYDLPKGIEAQSPDQFLSNLFDLDPDAFVSLLKSQAAERNRPPISFDGLLDAMAKTVPDLVALVREHLQQTDP